MRQRVRLPAFALGTFHLRVWQWAKEEDDGGLVFIDLGVILLDGSMRSPGVAWLSHEH
jgi:hypothetical protein